MSNPQGSRVAERQKYRCRCGAEIETAMGPDKLVAGDRDSIDFALDLAIARFADRLPLERQVRQMARDGLDVGIIAASTAA